MFESQCLLFRNTILGLLQQCKNMTELKQIHAQIITSPLLPQTDHYFYISRLLFFCSISEVGSLSYATRVFNSIQNPNLFVYNVMIRAYASRINDNDGPNSHKSFILYKQMLSDGIAADSITLPFILKECARRQDGDAGRSIHGHIVRVGLLNDIFVENSMINLYSVCGDLNSARQVFDEMSKSDFVSWNSMIVGCLRNGEMDLALDLFRKMKTRNNITWNSIITGFVQGGRPKEAIEFFHEMQILNDDNVRPDKITVASVISACASLGALDHGRWVHNYLARSGLECDMVIRTALVDMYGKCGSVEGAVKVFNEMPKKDILAWTAMISVFAIHGYAVEAINLFKRMTATGMKPNSVTFIGLLTACAHSGIVGIGRWFFKTMRSVYAIEPQTQHYACMVDVLSRAGQLDEAEGLIRDMPMEPDEFVWGALLGGCQMHGNYELGEKVAKHLIDMKPNNHAFYVNLGDIYAKAGRFDAAKSTRAFMFDKGIKKTAPGSSMIEIDGVVHEFSVRGSSEVVIEEIKRVLYSISDEMKVKLDIINFIE